MRTATPAPPLPPHPPRYVFRDHNATNEGSRRGIPRLEP
jgi:hypothetical protein